MKSKNPPVKLHQIARKCQLENRSPNQGERKLGTGAQRRKDEKSWETDLTLKVSSIDIGAEKRVFKLGYLSMTFGWNQLLLFLFITSVTWLSNQKSLRWHELQIDTKLRFQNQSQQSMAKVSHSSWFSASRAVSYNEYFLFFFSKVFFFYKLLHRTLTSVLQKTLKALLSEKKLLAVNYPCCLSFGLSIKRFLGTLPLFK